MRYPKNTAVQDRVMKVVGTEGADRALIFMRLTDLSQKAIDDCISGLQKAGRVSVWNDRILPAGASPGKLKDRPIHLGLTRKQKRAQAARGKAAATLSEPAPVTDLWQQRREACRKEQELLAQIAAEPNDLQRRRLGKELGKVRVRAEELNFAITGTKNRTGKDAGGLNIQAERD